MEKAEHTQVEVSVAAGIAIIFALAGFFGGREWQRRSAIRPSTGSYNLIKLSPASSTYKYARPLLGCEVYHDNKEALQDTPLQSSVSSLITNIQSAGAVQNISVYYRNLNNGHWMGVNEYEQYDPASLFKMPVLIAYLKKAEIDPTLLTRKVDVQVPLNNDGYTQSIVPSQSIQTGKSYTIDELLRYMILYSDNKATDVLRSLGGVMDDKSFVDIVTDLGIPRPADGSAQFTVDPKQYALFLRVLYNATYLDAQMSDYALTMLSQTDFNDGLRAGVPAAVDVAHKFGEGQTPQDKIDGVKELHDCGIVYDANNPYALCIMTKGTDFTAQSAAIRDVSARVYQYVSGLGVQTVKANE